METNDIIFFPQTMSGIAYGIKDSNSWQGRLLKVARTPFIGVLTSIAASLLTLIQLVCAVALIPLIFLGVLICGKTAEDGAAFGTLLGFSIFTQAYCIANIVTLGFLGWRGEFKLG